MRRNEYDTDWGLVTKFFPDGWEEKAKELGAVTRLRKFKGASDILRLLLIHLADGCSLRETVARAHQGGMASISDVALLKRLRLSSEWFRWMSLELLKRRGVKYSPPEAVSGYNIKSVDATVVTEPGSTGTDWRLHYCIKLFGLQCDQFLLSRPNVGESFVNFDIKNDDLLIGDRAYGRLKGMAHVSGGGGHFLARLKNKAFKIFNKEGKEIGLTDELSPLSIGEVKEIAVTTNKTELRNSTLRICALRKSDEEAEKSMRKAVREQKRKQRKVISETINLHRYIILVTSLPEDVSASQVLELYRIRWQIEIAFKRLKSIMGLGHLPKKDEESSRAWLHGKLFVALLTQAIADEGAFFSPWGYPMRTQ